MIKSQTMAFKNKKAWLSILIIFLVLLFVWSKLQYPSSYTEVVFLSKLRSISKNTEQINLTELISNNWELVCESNGYDEPLNLKKYRKTFPTAGAMQDGSWGLIFIKSDGSFNLISSSCNIGVYIKFSGDRCIPRQKAIIIKEKNSTSNSCVIFSAFYQEN